MSGIRNRFFDRLPFTYGAGVKFNTLEIDGLDKNRTSAGSFSTLGAYLDFTITYNIFYKSILWDIPNAGTYTFKIGLYSTALGDTFGTYVASGRTADVEFPINKILQGRLFFSLTRDSSAVWDDYSTSAFTGTYFSWPKSSYYDGMAYAFALPIKLVYRPFTLELY